MTTNLTVNALAWLTVFGGALLASACNETASEKAELPLTKAAHAAPKELQPKPATSSLAEQIRLGEHLVSTSGCHDCHTPWTNGPKGPVPT